MTSHERELLREAIEHIEEHLRAEGRAHHDALTLRVVDLIEAATAQTGKGKP